MHACSEAHLYLTLCDLMDCRPPGSLVHGIFLARILETVAISSARGNSWPRNLTLNTLYCKHKVRVLAAQSSLTLCDPVDCSPPGSVVHGILQARILEWVPIAFSRGSSQRRDLFLFLAVLGLCCSASFSLAVASRGYTWLQRAGFPLLGLLMLQDSGSRQHELLSFGAQAQ